MKECEVCERNFMKLHIHHKDGDRDNNNSSNLIEVCEDCHTSIHRGINLKGKGHKKRIRDYNNNLLVKNHLIKLRKFWLENKEEAKTFEQSREIIKKVIKNEEYGLNITDIVNNTKLPRSMVRSVLKFLLGAGKVSEQIYGRSKVYYGS